MHRIKSFAFAALLTPVVAGYALVGAARGAFHIAYALVVLGRDGLRFGAPVIRR
jgi:hypothetical protein